MRHWTEKFISIPYQKYNCSKFVEHVLRTQFGIDYNFPQSEGTLFKQSQMIKDYLPFYCEKTENPEEGDLVLMHGKRRMCHVGIFVPIKRSKYVLHSEVRMGTSALHNFNLLAGFGYSVEGVYKWRR